MKNKDKYIQLPFHFKIPHGMHIDEVCDMVTDKEDNVYCLTRGNVPVIVFNKNGDYINSWGNDNPFAGFSIYNDDLGENIKWEGSLFVSPHSISIDEEENLWIVDRRGNTVSKFTKNGKRLLMIVPDKKNIVKVISNPKKINELSGKIIKPSEKNKGYPFSYPSSTLVSKRKNGYLYVSDGYANCNIHIFNKNTYKYIKSWGSCGTEKNMFNLPHDLCINYGGKEDGSEDEIIVADRENYRIQIFTVDGKFIREWRVFRPCGICIHKFGDKKALYVCQLPSPSDIGRNEGPQNLDEWTPNIGNCISIHDIQTGEQLYRIGSERPTEKPHGFMFPHAITVNSEGDIYTSDVSYHMVGIYRPHLKMTLVTLRKLKLIRGKNSRKKQKVKKQKVKKQKTRKKKN